MLFPPRDSQAAFIPVELRYGRQALARPRLAERVCGAAAAANAVVLVGYEIDGLNGYTRFKDRITKLV